MFLEGSRVFSGSRVCLNAGCLESHGVQNGDQHGVQNGDQHGGQHAMSIRASGRRHVGRGFSGRGLRCGGQRMQSPSKPCPRRPGGAMLVMLKRAAAAAHRSHARAPVSARRSVAPMLPSKASDLARRPTKGDHAQGPWGYIW
eukprot:356300-Chlamydomonas_euryale.AAC.1